MAGDPERYATVAELAGDLGIYGDLSPEQTANLTTALGAASDEIDRLCDLPNTPDYSVPTANLAARRLSARWHKRADSPFGITGGFSDVPMYVIARDPDIRGLILSMRTHMGIA